MKSILIALLAFILPLPPVVIQPTPNSPATNNPTPTNQTQTPTSGSYAAPSPSIPPENTTNTNLKSPAFNTASQKTVTSVAQNAIYNSPVLKPCDAHSCPAPTPSILPLLTQMVPSPTPIPQKPDPDPTPLIPPPIFINPTNAPKDPQCPPFPPNPDSLNLESADRYIVCLD